MEEPDESSRIAVAGVELSLKPKCITCGNTRTFFVSTGEQISVWNTFERMPAGARVLACGRCRSRRSVIMDYDD
jgi:hypothetical protein